MAHNEIAAALEQWRNVERQLEQVDEGSVEAEQLQAEAARLRNLIKGLTPASTSPKTETATSPAEAPA